MSSVAAFSLVVPPSSARLREIARTAAVWLYIATLAWAPFPLGGAIAWAAGLQEILIALCWLLWATSTLGAPGENRRSVRVVVIPLLLAAAALVWACLQIVPGVPAGWVHPLWSMASETMGVPVEGVISINPWRTEAEILKLLSYGMAFWLAFRLGRRPETANLLLIAVIVIGAVYAAYAFVLAFAGSRQTEVFYAVPYRNTLLSGPFMLHNSFATYCGLAVIAAVAKLFSIGSGSIIAGRGAKRLALTIMEYCLGRGALVLVAGLLTFAGVVASASRAGFVSTLCGLFALALAALLVLRHGSSRFWAGIGALAAALPLMILLAMNGDTLADRIGQLLDNGTADAARLTLWAAANRMIADAPWLGLGLGTFEDAYPLYASQVLPNVMDKAHCDYLEFAAGIGLPAAIAFWTALLWLVALCLKGVWSRRRNRLYSLAAVGASVLAAVHSSVDFSLQLPAVALSFATLLGLGVGQSFSVRR
jgi:O-antigen ligase